MRTVKATISREQLNKADLSITFTMPVEDWRDLQKITEGKGWPQWEFSELIGDALSDIMISTDRVSFPDSSVAKEQ